MINPYKIKPKDIIKPKGLWEGKETLTSKVKYKAGGDSEKRWTEWLFFIKVYKKDEKSRIFATPYGQMPDSDPESPLGGQDGDADYGIILYYN